MLNFDDGIGYSPEFLNFVKSNQVNPFASFVEEFVSLDEIKTVYCCKHPKLKDVAEVVHVKGRHMFLINYHDQNVQNSQYLTIIADIPAHYLKRFFVFNFLE